ncbi:claspin-like [Sitophilus oryzae]|uniref:Claspin-like n=1 Tax=Sitophilus oryzae TaxID=7048 RepID=A0A6J2YHL9_SITOR|nr:claspin-like [Sitophilus oryzae]
MAEVNIPSDEHNICDKNTNNEAFENVEHDEHISDHEIQLNTNKNNEDILASDETDTVDINTAESDISNNSECNIVNNKLGEPKEDYGHKDTEDNNSEDENNDNRKDILSSDDEEDVTTNNKSKRKHISRIESDSETEETVLQTKNNSEPVIYRTDSKDEIIPDNNIENNTTSILPRKRHIIQIDSDSETEEITSETRISDENNSEPVIYTTDSKGEIVPENSSNVIKSRLATLCDSDSEEEYTVNDDVSPPNDPSEEDMIEQTQHNNEPKKSRINTKKPKVQNKVSDDPKPMTPKEAAELRKEIQSESQRMLREKNVSLPYHKPKPRSLKEFLARRPKLATATSIIGKAPPSVAIKMSTEQLELVSKQLKIREKEVREFYKSESESDGENEGESVSQSVNNDENKENDKPEGDRDMLTEDISLNENTEDKINNIESDNKENTEALNEDGIHKGQEDIITEKNTDNEDEILLSESLEHVNDCGTDNILENIDKSTEQVTNDVIEKDIIEPMEIDNVLETDNNVENNYNDKDSNLEEPEQELNTMESESYKFNLDDIGQSPEKQYLLESNSHAIDGINKESINEKPSNESSENNAEALKENLDDQVNVRASRQFTFTDLDREIEAHNEDNNESNVVKSKMEILKEKLVNFKPKLSGDPNHVIDLDSGVTKPKEVFQLMERFAKHVSTKKYVPKHKLQMSIVTVETGGDIHKETVAVNVDEDDKDITLEEKPGARLMKLKEDLQNQMAERKSQIWQQKAAKGMGKTEEIDESNKEQIVDEYDILDDEDEEDVEMTDEEYSEDEIDENDVEMKDKPKKKSEFLDEEAEESEAEENDEPSNKEGFEENVLNENAEDDNEEEDSDNEDNGEDNSEDSNNSNDAKINEEPPEGCEVKKKILKRIVQFEDDSDDDSFHEPNQTQKQNLTEHLDSTVTATDEDDFIPPHQPNQTKTPLRQPMSQSKSITDFLTPISFLTSIQNLASATKSKDIVSPFKVPGGVLSSPKNERDGMPQRKLFHSDVISSQSSVDTFSDQTTTQDTSSSNESKQTTESQTSTVTEEPPNTQDLLGICSGEFTGVTQPEPTIESFTATQNEEIKALGSDQDMIISQLLDEEELENFKKKFESPVLPTSQRVTVEKETQEIVGGGVIDSDNEDGSENDNNDVSSRKKKRNSRRIQFSDDESSDNEENDDEEIDLHDEDLDENEDNVDNVGYDSEENEVDLDEEGVKKQQNMKLGDFLDEEAELSESEWGSEDEDERDLDKLEIELGDTEKFDDEKMKEDLEKIHMRRMLDDDTREVKMLQELLLEDGELHGTGRQRQFKWKNIDLTDDQRDGEKGEEEIYMDEEESEEQWRKKRHEREMFLKEKLKKTEDIQDDLVNHSQFLKIGQKVLERSQSLNSQNSTPNEKSEVDSTENTAPKTPFPLLSKRGSFLSRGDQVLQRLAEYTKVSAEINVSSSKTTKNFVFQSVSSLEVSVSSAANKKRKAAEGTPNVLKKLRLNTTFSPADKKKKDKSERARKLFNF